MLKKRQLFKRIYRMRINDFDDPVFRKVFVERIKNAEFLKQY